MPASPPKSPKSRQPRWGWSAVSVLSGGDQAFDEVLQLLPSTRSAREVIVGQLANMKAHVHGWLHQDEFGPSRGEQTAAIRALMQSALALCDLLRKHASNVRPHLDVAIRDCGDGLHSCLHAVEAAAVDVEKDLKRNGASIADLNWLSRVRQRAAMLLEKVEMLDDKAEGQIAETAELRGFDLSQVVRSDNFGFEQIEECRP